VPHAPKKLHSFAVIVKAPSTRTALGTTVGAPNVKLVLRNAEMPLTSTLVLVTVNSGVLQARPPEPVEAARSMDSEPQPRTIDAMESATSGNAGVAGPTIWTTAAVAELQVAHAVGCVHCALTLLLDRSVTDEPTLRSRLADTLLLGYTVMVESSDHKHVAAVSPGKLSRRVQVKAFEKPPRLVGASNFTSTLLPSLLNVADSSCGTAGTEELLRTVKVPKMVTPAWYSAALTPESDARIVYSPGVAPIRVTFLAPPAELLANSSAAGENARSPAAPVLTSTADS
jgi:hypothetical protein